VQAYIEVFLGDLSVAIEVEKVKQSLYSQFQILARGSVGSVLLGEPGLKVLKTSVP
jgi:hypothetical protein